MRSREPDYVFRRRQVPATKGKWRMISAEVQAARNND